MEQFKIDENVYTIEQIIDDLQDCPESIKREFNRETKKNDFIHYLNVPAMFDIEASSFEYKNGKTKSVKVDGETVTEELTDKFACMYIWQLGINGKVCIGRTWEEFIGTVYKLREGLKLSYKKRLKIFVHNLPYDSQFFRKWFEWDRIFAKEARKPLTMLTDGLMFCDSLALAGCSLEKVGEDLVKYKVNKKVGDLNYDLVRTPETELNETELGYCIFDVIVGMAYIQEQIETFGDITKVPLTKTGIVREYCREHCLNSKLYKKIIKGLTITGEDEYNYLKRAFTGGFTHANYHESGKLHFNVFSKDFTSSYPAVMLSEKYPMSTGEKVKFIDQKHFERYVSDGYGIVFNMKFKGLMSIVDCDSYLSESKCYDLKNTSSDNGRLISADEGWTTITSVDWETFNKVYTWDELEFGCGYIYKMAPLPKELCECIIHFYEGKTELKDVEGKEVEYQLLKGMLNSVYGCSVQDIINDIVDYDGEYESIKATNIEEQLKSYNNSRKRFLFYPWGVFVTAYARRNLWTGILELDRDYIYSDTDSVKYKNPENHEEYFREYNENITKKIEKILTFHGIDSKRACPKTVDGVEKPLGVWDDDGVYTRFKTLGAKRYLVEFVNKKGELEIKSTIAGSNKKKTSKWLSQQEDPFATFTEYMEVPEDYSGRLVSYYLDEPFTVEVTDYKGNTTVVHERSAIHMKKSCYNLTLSPAYATLMGAAYSILPG